MECINPIKLIGNWKEGYAIDYHSIYSHYIGVDLVGNKRFDTKRTCMGQLLYEFKYGQDKDKLDQIINLISPFLSKWNITEKIDVIIPVPSSNQQRTFQPVTELSKKIGIHLNKRVVTNVLKKTNPVQSKDLLQDEKDEILGTIEKIRNAKEETNILLLDDLYDTGKTLMESVKVLKLDPNINDIYVLTLTKRR